MTNSISEPKKIKKNKKKYFNYIVIYYCNDYSTLLKLFLKLSDDEFLKFKLHILMKGINDSTGSNNTESYRYTRLQIAFRAYQQVIKNSYIYKCYNVRLDTDVKKDDIETYLNKYLLENYKNIDEYQIEFNFT